MGWQIALLPPIAPTASRRRRSPSIAPWTIPMAQGKSSRANSIWPRSSKRRGTTWSIPPMSIRMSARRSSCSIADSLRSATMRTGHLRCAAMSASRWTAASASDSFPSAICFRHIRECASRRGRSTASRIVRWRPPRQALREPSTSLSTATSPIGCSPTPASRAAASATTPQFSDMRISTSKSGAIVFRAGTDDWSAGLSEVSPRSPKPSRVSPVAQQITRNLLARFIDAPQSFTPVSASKSDGTSERVSGSISAVLQACNVLDCDGHQHQRRSPGACELHAHRRP